MNRDRRHIAEEIVFRCGEWPILLEVIWRYDGGVHLEPGHSRNGYDRGWWCYKIEARDPVTGEVEELEEQEIDEFLEKYHPDNLPDETSDWEGGV